MLYKVKETYKNFLKGVIDIILPPRCPITGELVSNNGTLSSTFWSQLNFIQDPFCPTCGLPYSSREQAHHVCASCLMEPPSFTVARSALYYDDASRKLILTFKHADRTLLAPLLTQWLIQCAPNTLHDADYIIPVPLHRWRLLKRRYNQSAELARLLSKKLGIAYAPHMLRRRRNTDSQGHKNKTQRRKNVRGAFHILPHHKTQLAGKHVIVIDDVYTTGATLESCAKTLCHAGVTQITVLTLARATPKT
jgi:ComF family protein